MLIALHLPFHKMTMFLPSRAGLHDLKQAHAGRCSTGRNGGGGPPGPWPAASSNTCPPIPQVPQPRKSTEKFPLEDRKTPSDPVWHVSYQSHQDRASEMAQWAERDCQA